LISLKHHLVIVFKENGNFRHRGKLNPSHHPERGVTEPLPRGNNMEAQERQATPRQLAYLQRLTSERGTTMEKPLGELTTAEASELISTLLEKSSLGQIGRQKSGNGAGVQRRTDFGQGARLGMAFKCVYRKWASSGANMFRHKDDFISAVLDTYKLINEIAEMAEMASSKGVSR
jgi:hypothetical protein